MDPTQKKRQIRRADHVDTYLIRNEMEKKDGRRIFLFYGQESFIYQEMILAARLSLLSKDLADFNDTRLDGRQYSLEEVLNMARTPPVKDPYRLTVVSDAPYFQKTKKDGAASKSKDSSDPVQLMQDFIRDRIFFSCLVFTADEVEKGSASGKNITLYRLIEKHGMAVECKPLKGTELTGWIDGRIRRLGKTITRDAVQVLVERAGNDLRLLRQEMQKAAAYAGDKGKIEREDILAVGSRTLENNIFSLIDAVSAKNRKTALQLLADMLLMNEPPVKILFMLIRQVRMMVDSALLLAEGVRTQDLGPLLNVKSPYEIQKTVARLSSFPMEKMQRMLAELLQADEDLKTGYGEPRMILEKVLIRMSA